MSRVSAPGSVMLFGEHAVLNGKPAIVASIDKRITVEVSDNQNQMLVIESALGQYSTSLDKIELADPFKYVLAVCQHFKAELKTGITLNIESEFSHEQGLGSSAAVTVASVGGLINHLEGVDGLDRRRVFAVARECILAVQGRGSGMDVLASTFGSVLVSDTARYMPRRLVYPWAFSLAYSGKKVPTMTVLQTVKEKFKDNEAAYLAEIERIDEATQMAITAAKDNDDRLLNKACELHQEAMTALGLNDASLQNLIEKYQAEKGVVACKISGSGLGDSIIFFGHFDDDMLIDFPETIAVSAAHDGVTIDG